MNEIGAINISQTWLSRLVPVPLTSWMSCDASCDASRPAMRPMMDVLRCASGRGTKPPIVLND